MRTAAIVLAVIAALLGGFAWWGIYSRAGRQRFDEMAGMIPFFAAILAAVLAVASIVVWWWLAASAHAASRASSEPPIRSGANATEPLPDTAAKAVDGDAVETIHTVVWSGFHSRAEAEEVASEILDGSIDEAALRAAVSAEFSRKAAAEQQWPRETDCDRIDRAFAALERAGLVALQNAGFTMSDGREDAREERDVRGAQRCRGYCFFHSQDVERAVAGEALCIAFGSFDDDGTAATLEIGRTVRRALEDAGLKVTWNDDPEQRIELCEIVWQKRGP